MNEPILPQRATRSHAEVLSVEWLFEPSWPGDRLMATVSSGSVSLTDAAGEPASEAFPEVVEVLSTAVLAQHAVIDGIWTAQPFIGDGSLARRWAETLAEEGLDDEVLDPMESERRRAFVAVDLIEIDGEPLNEVPFQERRRLLESVIDEGVRVRLSPIVKQPLTGWLVGWRENGFTHYLAKHQNSRYHPGEMTEDWLEISVTAEPARGVMGRLLGRRERVRRVSD